MDAERGGVRTYMWHVCDAAAVMHAIAVRVLLMSLPAVTSHEAALKLCVCVRVVAAHRRAPIARCAVNLPVVFLLFRLTSQRERQKRERCS